ncbi:MAG: exonuclease subunit SbcD [Candidatus Calescibacterium sp.]|nr:exonuclease subunit SbcD [Candidatus Calescibacterium sp.]MDW8132769.1 exonuclease subunit SbcD [Candidatus Calescibacterium sp.]
MRFVHIADLHLGKKIKSIRGDIELDFYNPIRQINQIIREFKPNFLFVSGDVFHYRNPSQDSEELFIEFLLNSYENVDYTFVISGNHDNTKKLSNIYLFNKYINRLSRKKIFIYTDLDLRKDVEEENLKPISCDNVDIIMIPFIEYRSAINAFYNIGVDKDFAYSFVHSTLISKFLENSVNRIKILLGHMYLENSVLSGTESKNFINPTYYVKYNDLDDRIVYCALGHVHRFQKIGPKNVFYSGSLIPLDFSENFDHGIILGEIIDKFPKISFEKLSYKEFMILQEDKDLFEKIEKNKDKYLKILYTSLSNEVLEKIIKFDNVLKIQKVDNTSFTMDRKNDSVVITDAFDILEMYRKYCEIEKREEVLPILVNKVAEIERMVNA